MSVWTRVASWLGLGEQRAAQLDPFIQAGLASRYGGFGAMSVNPDTAARKVAVGSTIRLITNTARNMPAHAFRGQGADTEQLPSPMVLRDPDGTGRGLDDLVAQMAWSLAGRGNLMVHVLGYNSAARPDLIEVLHPDRVRPDIDGSGKLWWKPDSGPRIDGRDVRHVRMFPVPGAVLGLSPIEEHAATIGMGISAEKFGADFFAAGGHPTSILKSKTTPTKPQADAIKAKFRLAADSREPVVMPEDIDYQAIQVTPEESQFLDTQGYSSAECARIFGPGFAEVLGYETGGSMTYANAVDSDLKLLKYSLDAYLTPIERVLSSFLPTTQYVKLNRDSLLRMNPLDRYRKYEIGTRIGMETPNEQRALEDKPRVAWGDLPYTAAKQPAAGDQSTGAADKAQTGAPQ